MANNDHGPMLSDFSRIQRGIKRFETVYKVTFELVAHRQEAAIEAAKSMGFREVATLKGRVRDLWNNYEDLVLLELPLEERGEWWRY